MSGFLLNHYQQLPKGHVYEEFAVCEMIDTLIAKIIPSEGESNILHILGYDIALRNWIKDHTGALILHDKKPRGKKDGEQLQAQVLHLETNLQAQLDELKMQLRDAQKSIKALQHLQHGKKTMQALLHDSVAHNPDVEQFSEEGQHDENDGLSDNNDDDEIEESNDANEKVEQSQENNDDGEEDVEDEEEVVMPESDDDDEVEEDDNK